MNAWENVDDFCIVMIAHCLFLICRATFEHFFIDSHIQCIQQNLCFLVSK